MYWLKMCKAWVRRQLRWAWNWLKLNVTSSNVLRIIIHWLSARRDVGLTQGSLIPKEHSLYRALKHSIRQHKLDLNSSKTKKLPPTCKHSTPAPGRKLSSSKELAWNLYTVWQIVLENTKQANSRSFSTYFMISVTDANLLTHAEMQTCPH